MDHHGHSIRARVSAAATTAAVVGALLLAGCSGSDDDEPRAEPTAGAIEVTPSGSPGADATGDPTDDPSDEATPGVPDDLASPTTAPPSATPTDDPDDPGGVVGSLDPEVARQVPDLCKVFTRADFERVLGLPAEGSPEVPVALATVYSSCSYAGPSDHPTLVLTAYDEDDVDDILDDGAGDDDVAIDDAEWSPRTGLLVEIDDADWTLQVRVTDRRGRAVRAPSIRVAREVLGRL